MRPTDRLEIVAKLPNLLCHEYDDDGLLVSRRNRLYKIPDLASPRLEEVGRIPWGVRQWPAHFRLIDRALKAGIQLAIRVDPGRHLVFAGSGWWVVTAGTEARRVGPLPVGRPMARGVCAVGGTAYVGEYRSNPDRGPVRILYSDNLESFDTAWTFPALTVRHVHALVPDPYHAGRIWILTGDFDHESVIWYTDDRFESVHRYLGLGQRTRATDLICLPDRLVWGMDSPLETPRVLEADRSVDAIPRATHELGGPSYYTSRNESGGCYVGTTVEPGPAVRDDFARLFAWTPEESWREVARWRHSRAPQYGIVYLPRGVLPGSFVTYSTRALRPGEGGLTIARDRALNG